MSALASASSVTSNPEIGKAIRTGSFHTNVHDHGTGDPVLLVHGSGPGVSAWANWRLVIPPLALARRVIAPDMSGFGYTERVDAARYDMDAWVAQLLALADAMALERFDLVGNSFGGALSLAFAIRHPGRVRRLVLMGSVGVRFPLTKGLDAVWGYQPSVDNMRRLMDVFTHDRSLVSDDLVQLRYQASIRPGVQEAFSTMFPAPRQRWVDAMAADERDIRRLPHPTLILHGRDDQVIPLQASLTLADWIVDSQLHVFGRCGHWTQIEHRARFIRLVDDFLAEPDARAA